MTKRDEILTVPAKVGPVPVTLDEGVEVSVGLVYTDRWCSMYVEGMPSIGRNGKVRFEFQLDDWIKLVGNAARMVVMARGTDREVLS